MSNRKSVIEIDVQDGEFKKFAALFAKFKGEAKEAAKDMGEAATQTARVAAAKKEILDAQAKQAKLTKQELSDLDLEARAKAKVAAEDKKSADLRQKAWEDARKKYALQSKVKEEARAERADTAKGLRDTAKWTADIARNIASGAISLGKWLAFGAVAGGFGLGGLASNASNLRRQAQGIGSSTGDLRSASVNFGKYIDPDSALANIANAQSDVSKRGVFSAVGQSYAGRNPADILPELLPKLVNAFRAGGSTTQGADARGLTQLVGIEDLRRLSTLTEKELSETIEAYKRDRKAFAVDDSVGQSWQEFLVSLHRASQGIEVSLIKNLQALTPYLKDFAEGIAKAIDAFVSSGRLQVWIKAVGEGLEKLGAYLGSKEFRDDVAAFMEAIHRMASTLRRFFPDVEVKPQADQPTPKASSAAGAAVNVYKAVWDHLVGNDKQPLSVRNNNPGNLRVPGSTTDFQKFGSENDGLRALINQIGLYEKRDHLTTLRGIISKYSPGNENNTEALIANASKRTGFGADQALDPKSIDQIVKVVLAITKQENGASSYTPQQIQLLVQNQTGGNANLSVAGLAPN